MNDEKKVKLKRTVSLPFIIFYGLGTMIGGGIYALTGKVAGEAGMYAPLSFAVAALLAMITSFSYAEMVARFPHSSGESRYVHHAFGLPWFTRLIGFLVVFMGVTSSAALSTAAVGFILDIAIFPEYLLTIIIVLFLGSLAAWGISESVLVVSIITLIEVLGLLFVILTAGEGTLIELNDRWHELMPSFSMKELVVWSSIFGGAFMAFYAFIGFEDMVSLAEEVKNVRRNMPVAIITCILITLILYISISVVGVFSGSPTELAESNTPLAEILRRNDVSTSPLLMILISLLAVLNGALVQIIMASRIMYGMAKSGNAPSFLNVVSDTTHTPIRSTILSVTFVLTLAIFFDLTTLVKATSAIILFVFSSINFALLKIKITEKERPKDLVYYPIWLSFLGLVTCVSMLVIGLFY